MNLHVIVAAIATLALAPSASALALPSEGFEAGLPAGWTLTGAWTVSDCLAASGAFSLHYARLPECDYDLGLTDGTATTPPIAVPAIDPGAFAFESFIDTEFPEDFSMCDYDRANVLVSVDGGPFFVVIPDVQCGPQEAWTLMSIDLGTFAGQTIRVQFAFDSVDDQYNAQQGWAIDNVVLTGPSVPTPELGSVMLLGAGFLALAGVAFTTRRA